MLIGSNYISHLINQVPLNHFIIFSGITVRLTSLSLPELPVYSLLKILVQQMFSSGCLKVDVLMYEEQYKWHKELLKL